MLRSRWEVYYEFNEDKISPKPFLTYKKARKYADEKNWLLFNKGVMLDDYYAFRVRRRVNV